MRKIETLMNSAITREVDWKLDNTQVVGILNVSIVYLYGNMIAQVGDTWMRLYDGNHQTKTTMSRLNALLAAHGNGERVFQKNYQWFLSDSNGQTVPFEDGMELN